MANIEFLRTPIFISATNMVTPLTTIKYDVLYANTLIYLKMIVNILQIGIQTIGFMMKEGLTELFANLTIEKIIYILVIYNLLILTAIDKQRRKITEQNTQIESLEKQINYLKKTERMREDLDELWLQDVRRYHLETNNKITAMEKKIKKMDKEIKIYE
jgi:hypothetical protein